MPVSKQTSFGQNGETMRLTRCILVCLFACSPATRVPPTAGPPDLPPLPPESSSGIGLVRDRAADLALDPNQLAQLEALDQQLEEANRPYEVELDALVRAAGRSAPAASGGGGKRRGGGVSMSRGGQTATPGQANAPEPTPEQKQKMDEFAQQERVIRQKIRANDSSFLERALRLLRPQQQERAVEILRQHGYGQSTGP
jgi:hypothetical protein